MKKIELNEMELVEIDLMIKRLEAEKSLLEGIRDKKECPIVEGKTGFVYIAARLKKLAAEMIKF